MVWRLDDTVRPGILVVLRYTSCDTAIIPSDKVLAELHCALVRPRCNGSLPRRWDKQLCRFCHYTAIPGQKCCGLSVVTIAKTLNGFPGSAESVVNTVAARVVDESLQGIFVSL